MKDVRDLDDDRENGTNGDDRKGMGEGQLLETAYHRLSIHN